MTPYHIMYDTLRIIYNALHIMQGAWRNNM